MITNLAGLRIRAERKSTQRQLPDLAHIPRGEIGIDVAGERVHLKQGDGARFGGNVHHCHTTKENIG